MIGVLRNYIKTRPEEKITSVHDRGGNHPAPYLYSEESRERQKNKLRSWYFKVGLPKAAEGLAHDWLLVLLVVKGVTRGSRLRMK